MPEYKKGDNIVVTFKGTVEWVGTHGEHQVLLSDGDRPLAVLTIPERMLKKEASDVSGQ